MTEVRLYVEGDRDLRPGFNHLFAGIRRRARPGATLSVKLCGGNKTTWDLFCRDRPPNLRAHYLLLIDADSPLALEHPRGRFLKERWRLLDADHPEDCYHLMVQMMESWLLAEPEKLADYYGRGFRDKPLPRSGSIEQIRKDRLEEILRDATQGCEKKGPYLRNKREHAAALLQKIDPQVLRDRAPHFNRLCETLERLLGAS